MAELSREQLLHTAGQPSFDRALDYLDRVSGRRLSQGRVHATVSGRARYRVQLTDTGHFFWSCECPWAMEGNCCKHVVAVGLVHLFDREHGEQAPQVPEVATHLRSLDHESLVGLLLAESERSPALALELEARAAVVSGDTGVLSSLFESALEVSEPVPQEQASYYARAVHTAVDTVRALEQSSREEDAQDLLEAVHACAEDAEDLVEDEEGEVAAALDRLHEIDTA
ncbi:SWIM zinc finger family protein [Nocardiopsis sp. HNM0947]|uniref:SWIM zinc finger family protein n=1 Tax=Nocardiopsis coralli TaxID=2772213 RepID=A0ABR9P1H5_9ACTN|nr:SWIM zinc finger family protein [Nocardiopsis coralli]MBE2997685.1 SWIM zinc finger family protein [Nocardiopsis coralli]